MTSPMRRQSVAVNDAAWKIAERGTSLEYGLLAFDVATHAVNGGDYRVWNVHRLVSSTHKLVDGVDLSSNSTQARAAQTRISDAIRTLKALLNQTNLEQTMRSNCEAAVTALGQLGRAS